MLGGGYFTAQNKVLPGSYINFVGVNNNSVVSERGTVAMALELDWGPAGIQSVDPGAAFSDELKIFGHEYTDDALLPIREVMKNAKQVILYRLNAGGEKATCAYATAKHPGKAGNDLKIVISANADEASKYDVKTYMGITCVDTQLAVASAADLASNEFVDFKSEASLAVTAGTSLTGGTNSAVTGANHTAFLTALENEAFNILVTASSDATVKALYVAYTKRMIEDVGVKIQTVLYNQAADHEGIINVTTAADLVYWVAGAEASCALSKTLTNARYDGEIEITKAYTQAQLKDAIAAGELVFHKVADSYRILRDINSLVTTTTEKSDDFKSNQTMRVINQVGNDVATIFNTQFLGLVPNDASGRVALWSALVSYFNQLVQLRAIEEYNTADIVVEPGATKNAVVVNTVITPVNCMEILYMTVVVA